MNSIETLKWNISDEGLEYAVMHYSRWPQIDDNRFHELREAYVKAAEELETYIAGMRE